MTTYEHIAACKPASILDVLPREVFREIDDPDHTYIHGRNCYEWKYAVAKFLQPRSVLEIGVRFGYSLACFVAASKRVEFVTGIDSECYVPGSNAIAKEAVLKVKKVGAIFLTKPSMDIKSIGSSFDLVHIDGSHNYENCLHDLNLCKGKARAILIDDVDGCDDDRRACNDWIKQNPALVREVLRFPSHTGDMLILLQETTPFSASPQT